MENQDGFLIFDISINQKHRKMNIDYLPTVKAGSLRTVHVIVINGERLETTRSKEVLLWAKPRIFYRYTWKMLKECVRRGQRLQVGGGGLFGEADNID